MTVASHIYKTYDTLLSCTARMYGIVHALAYHLAAHARDHLRIQLAVSLAQKDFRPQARPGGCV